jgi:hypothetical protein
MGGRFGTVFGASGDTGGTNLAMAVAGLSRGDFRLALSRTASQREAAAMHGVVSRAVAGTLHRCGGDGIALRTFHAKAPHRLV